jgi:putative membrane protein
MPQDIINYFIHLVAGLLLVSVFVLVYTRITPYDELKLIRQGCISAAVSFGGALLGFVLTVASSITHSDNFMMFATWAALALAVQLAAYFLISRLIPELEQAMRADNRAVGLLLGSVSLTFGIVNAACLS